jgi:hypothetical protein
MDFGSRSTPKCNMYIYIINSPPSILKELGRGHCVRVCASECV